jgi:hypothetical protein
LKLIASARIFDGTVMLIGVVAGFVLASLVVGTMLMRRRERTAGSTPNVGPVSERWLSLHRAEDQ